MAKIFPLSIGTIRKIVFFCLFIGCSRMEDTEKEKLRRQNCKAEAIFRTSSDHFFSLNPPIHVPRTTYPWESQSNLPRITKDFFRCKGSSLNPPIVDLADPTKLLIDCEGFPRHGLPIINGKEGVYPILVDLLNYLQKKIMKRVVITCGHRCPIHNTYSDPTKENRISKHQIGAEVDFYVQSMEDRYEEVVGHLVQFFQENPSYKFEKESTEFKKIQTQLSNPAWTNREIVIQVYDKTEGRDLDNRHPHPYISISVKYDKQTKQKVVYEWSKANKGYPR